MRHHYAIDFNNAFCFSFLAVSVTQNLRKQVSASNYHRYYVFESSFLGLYTVSSTTLGLLRKWFEYSAEQYKSNICV